MRIKQVVRACMSVLVAGMLVFSSCPGVPGSAEGTADTFTNPILNNATNPYITYYNGYYYAIHTRPGGTSYIAVRKARRLDEIQTAEEVHVFNVPAGQSAIWAPELHQVNGKWYIYYSPLKTNGKRGVFVLEANTDDPQGSYTSKGEITLPTPDNIDGSVFTDQQTGQTYLMWSYQVAPNKNYIAHMSNPWTIDTPASLLTEPTLSWECTSGPVTEAPVALQKNGKTFVFYAGTGVNQNYTVGVAYNTDGNYLNPSSWSKMPQPLIQSSDTIKGPGSCGVFSSPDGTEDWIVYHARKAPFDSNVWCWAAQKIEWDANGMPKASAPAEWGTPIAVPSGEPAKSNNADTFIVDNTDSGFTTGGTGAWTASTTVPDYYGSNYVHDGNAGTSDKWAQWTPTVIDAGNYNVYIRWVSSPNPDDRPDAVPLEIKYAGGTDTSKTINEKQSGNTWTRLGTYALSAGTGNYVKLFASDAGYTTADAVKFVKLSTATFTVADKDGPIQGATVSVAGGTYQTDAAGQFSLDLEPGSYNYTVTKALYADGSGTLAVVNTSVAQPVVLQKNTSLWFTDPILNNATNPYITYYNGYYYAVHTRPGGTDYISVRKARRLDELQDADEVRVFQAPAGQTAIWAPELHQYNGKWYIYYTPQISDGSRQVFVLEANTDDPQGTYTSKGEIALPTPDNIDASMFQDQATGEYYLLWTYFTMPPGTERSYIAHMSNPWTIDSPATLLPPPVYSWECQDRPVVEGPIAMQRDGKTFIFYSGSDVAVNYCVGVAYNTDGNLLNESSWTKMPQPILQSSATIKNPGHNGLFTSPDGTEEWIVYHARQAPYDSNVWCWAAQKLEWDANGLPKVITPVEWGQPIKAPSGEAPKAEQYNIIVDNTDSGFTTGGTGAWTASTTVPGYYGTNYVHDGNAGTSDKWAQWTPTITDAGDYNVYIRWVNSPNPADRPAAAPLAIKYAGGTDTSKTINEKDNNGKWMLLGTYALSAGTDNYVKLFASDTGYTTADAVKFVKLNAATFTVTDADGPVQGATVSVAGGTYQTDAAGQAAPELEPGSYNYTVSKAGYEDGSGTLTVGSTSVAQPVRMQKSVSFGPWTVTTAPTTENTGTLTRVDANNSANTEAFTLPILSESNGYTYAQTKAATCTETGTGRYTYIKDSQAFTFDVTIPATGHQYGPWSVTMAPTTDTTGTLTRVCANNSSHTETFTLPKLSESNGYTYTETEAATATEDGTGTYTYTKDGQTFPFDVTIPATGYQYGPWSVTTAPTTETSGTLTRVAANDSSHTETFTLPTLSESNGYTYTETAAATATEDGTGTYTYTKDGQTFSFDVTIPATGYQYGPWTVTKTPTAEAAGEMTRAATNDSSHKQTLDLPKLSETAGYTYAETKAATATEPGAGRYTYVKDGQTFTFDVTTPATGQSVSQPASQPESPGPSASPDSGSSAPSASTAGPSSGAVNTGGSALPLMALALLASTACAGLLAARRRK